MLLSRCPSPGNPSLRHVLTREESHAPQSLPFTGQPFVEACMTWLGPSRQQRVAALHRAALR